MSTNPKALFREKLDFDQRYVFMRHSAQARIYILQFDQGWQNSCGLVACYLATPHHLQLSF